MRAIKRDKYGKWGVAYLMIAPALVLVTIFLLYPTFRAMSLSLFKWDGLGEAEYVGARNYASIFQDPTFWEAFQHNVIYTVAIVATTCVIGLLLALAIERRIRGWGIYKFIFYISVMLSVIVVSVLFTRLLEPNYGIVNSFLRSIGLESLAKSWLSDPKYAMGTIIFVNTWQYSGFTMILFLAAMEGISPSIQEAATIDGVKESQRIFYITLPCIKRSIFVIIMLQIIFAFKAFDTFWVLTNGGPGTSTEVLATKIYRTAFIYSDFGEASAMSVIMIVVITVISVFYIRKSKIGEQVIE